MVKVYAVSGWSSLMNTILLPWLSPLCFGRGISSLYEAAALDASRVFEFSSSMILFQIISWRKFPVLFLHLLCKYDLELIFKERGDEICSCFFIISSVLW